MDRFKSCWCILILAAFVSCQPEDVVDLPEVDPQVVLGFLPRTDSLWRGRISLSNGYLDLPHFEAVTDATVTIFQNGQVLEVLTRAVDSDPFAQDESLYIASNSRPVAGEVYTIEVASPLYGVVTASYVNPQLVEIDNFTVRLLGPNPGESTYDVRLILEFVDPVGPNFYEFQFTQTSDAMLNIAVTEGNRGPIEPADPRVKRHVDVGLGIAFDDAYFDGEAVQLEFTSLMLNPNSADTVFLAFLRNTSREYYEYVASADIQDKALKDPYAQPVQIRCNAIGGLGIFAGYTQSAKEFRLSK